MDIVLLTANPFALPTSRRATAIVHDGTTDLRLWPGPSGDRELAFAYGELARVLEQEKGRLPDKTLPVGELLRMHPGKLHADYLLWVASRPPEVDAKRAPAPALEILRFVALAALRYASERQSSRLAFALLGEGPGAVKEAERMAAIARTCQEFIDEQVASGKPLGIEEVVICAPSSGVTAEARRLLGTSVKTVIAAEATPKPVAVKAVRAASTRKSAGAKGTRKHAPSLSSDEVSSARAQSQPWDRMASYKSGQFFVHSKFGVGRVETHTLDGYVMVLFEDGETRKMIHAR